MYYNAVKRSQEHLPYLSQWKVSSSFIQDSKAIFTPSLSLSLSTLHVKDWPTPTVLAHIAKPELQSH